MTADLITRLRAALDHHERIAQAAAEQGDDPAWHIMDDGRYNRIAPGADAPPGSAFAFATTTRNVYAEHIAAHDPAFVLADITAKRAVLAEAFALAAKIDGEWACCHSAEQIERGECESESPDDMPIVRALAKAYGIA